jgi:transposase
LISFETLVPLLLPSQTDLCLDDIVLDDPRHLTLTATSTAALATCPSCGQSTQRVHSRYTRTLVDLPWANLAVRFRLRVRKFVCTTPECPRRIFTERLPSVMTPWARRTVRLGEHQRQLGLVAGAAAGARLAGALDQGVGRTTLLRLVRRAPLPQPPTPRVLGIDEFALRKGQSYGSVIVDLERGEVVDVLADREEDTFAEWLRAHPGVEIISRDRSTVYAAGASAGAPEAIQVADRFHLSRNLSEAIQRLFDRHPSVLREVVALLEHEQQGTDPQTAVTADLDQASFVPAATLRLPEPQPALTAAPAVPDDPDTPPGSHAEARYRAVKRLQQQGLGQRAIARQLQLHRRTVRRYMLADTFRERAVGPQSVSTVRSYLPYLLQRWEEGCRERQQLWREICTQGYTGSYSSVRRALAHLPSAKRPATSASASHAKVRPLSARKAAWLLLRRGDDLMEEELTKRQMLCSLCPDAAAAYPLVQRFGEMIRTRQKDALDRWLADVEASGIVELRNFAASLRRDEGAVRAALELPWSTGPVEGHINRVKMLKRQSYGRAKFDLLRRRVLLA